MGKPELIKNISDRTGLMQKDVDKVMKAFVSEVTATERIFIQGLGTFKKVTVKPKTVCNEITGNKPVTTPGKTVLKFKAIG